MAFGKIFGLLYHETSIENLKDKYSHATIIADFIWVNIGFNSTLITAGNKYVLYKISFLHIMEVNEEADSEDKVVINFTKNIKSITNLKYIIFV